jgi:hypothetical protein
MGALIFLCLYLLVGYVLYHHKWPEGFIPAEPDPEEYDRIRRIGRRRVLPLPERQRGDN